jgi:acyl-CoA thioester hydrolase
VRPLVFRFEPVRIEAWVTEVRAASFTIAYEILDERPDGERHVYTRARSVLTPFVFSQGRPRRISAEEREVLAGFADQRGEAG